MFMSTVPWHAPPQISVCSRSARQRPCYGMGSRAMVTRPHPRRAGATGDASGQSPRAGHPRRDRRSGASAAAVVGRDVEAWLRPRGALRNHRTPLPLGCRTGQRVQVWVTLPKDSRFSGLPALPVRPCAADIVVVEHLTALDVAFLEAEDSDPHVSLAMGVLAVVEGPIPDHDSLVSGVAERMLSAPRFKQVLRTQPLDLGAPEWVDDVNVDLSQHVRRAAVPRPGDDNALFRLAADVMERRLDRDRPLWECWIIEGLTDDRWAILTKIHHCIADGIAALHIFAGLFDDGDARHVRNQHPRSQRTSTAGDSAAAAQPQPAGLGRRYVACFGRREHGRRPGTRGRCRNYRRPVASVTGLLTDRTRHQHAALQRGAGRSAGCV